MHRQSIGSPNSKLQTSSSLPSSLAEEEKRRSGITVPPPPPPAEAEDEEAKDKTEKLVRPTSSSDRSIHIIPVFIFLCIVLLYLLSHDVSPKDLENIGGASLRSHLNVVRSEVSVEAAIDGRQGLKTATGKKKLLLHRKHGIP